MMNLRMLGRDCCDCLIKGKSDEEEEEEKDLAISQLSKSGRGASNVTTQSTMRAAKILEAARKKYGP